MPKITSQKTKQFRAKIYEFFNDHRRDLPWRQTKDPYAILVSEVMLQQTQVSRVLIKYAEFLNVFPKFERLAGASLKKLLSVWQGMGYNRRALLLQKTAQAIVRDYRGKMPRTYAELIELPGVGPYTASAIMAFAFNKPAVVLDTNIRRVYLHEFFQDKSGISDRQIRELVERTMDEKNPRKWFNALMDYGSWLATQVENPNRRSKHYQKQGAFEGSFRQVRAGIVRALLAHGALSLGELAGEVNRLEPIVQNACDSLIKDGIISYSRKKYRITD